MSLIADRYRRLTGDLTATLEAVPEDRWTSPTPCEGWSVRDVATHLVETQGMFLGMVGLEAPSGPPADEDLLGAWAVARDALQAALDDPATATRGFDGYTGPTTLEESVDGFVHLDLVVHRWDVARGAGLDERLDPDDVARVHAQARSFGDVLRTEGVCGPEVAAPSGADDQARMLAFLGRQV